MSASHGIRNPVRYSTVGSKTALESSLGHSFQMVARALSAAMDERVSFFLCFILYYVVEISVLSVQGQQAFLKVVESLMLAGACLTFVRLLLGDSRTSKIIVFMDSCLFGLTMGWMCFAATDIGGNNPGITVFFALNGVAILFLVMLDVRIQQKQICHNAIGGDAITEFPAHGNGSMFNENVGSERVSVDKATVTNDPFYSNAAEAYSTNRSGQRRDIENRCDTDISSSQQQSKSNSVTDSMIRLSGDEDVFDGFRVKIDKLPLSNPNIPSDVPWESFSYLEHRVDSSSCHIYSAFWRGTAVIIKLIKADRVASPMAVAEFQTEASILSRLEHPHIVKLLGSGRHPRRFLILELLDGGSLSHSLGLRAGSNNRITKRKFTYLETLQLARSLASALDYLHDKWQSSIHVIHRDLKPDNIGFTADGKLKLFDFGLCACVRTHGDRRDQYRLTGNTGTLRYMAPEVALGRQYNCSVDVYSFGVIIWQVLRSKVPFRDMGKKAYIQEVVVGGKRPPLDRRWPIGFSALLQRCWHEDKDARPSLSQVVTELDILIEEATGLGSVSVTMQISHKMRSLKSYGIMSLVRFRSMLTGLAFALMVVSIVILLFGGRMSGSSLAVVACAELYLAGISYVTGDRKIDELNTSKGIGLSSRAHILMQYFRIGRRRSPSVSMLELKRRPTDPHALSALSPSASRTCMEGCMDVEDPVSFNPLSPHSHHHSDENGAVGSFYSREEERERVKTVSNPAAESSI